MYVCMHVCMYVFTSYTNPLIQGLLAHVRSLNFHGHLPDISGFRAVWAKQSLHLKFEV